MSTGKRGAHVADLEQPPEGVDGTGTYVGHVHAVGVEHKTR